MFLQPLVENAYAHGLSKIERDGELLIDVHRQSDKVRISVINSGVGLQYGHGTQNGHVPHNGNGRPQNGHGVGLANVRSRLRLHYGNNCSFEMSQIDKTHVKVSIAFPLQLSNVVDDDAITRYGAE